MESRRSKQLRLPIRKPANPRKRRNNEESQHQKALFQWLRLYDSIAYSVTFHIPNGGFRNLIEAKILKSEGVKSGVPDIFLAMPCSGFHGLFIEMKSHKGVLSQNQKEMQSRLNAFNYKVVTCYSWFEAKDAILDYLGRENVKSCSIERTHN